MKKISFFLEPIAEKNGYSILKGSEGYTVAKNGKVISLDKTSEFENAEFSGNKIIITVNQGNKKVFQLQKQWWKPGSLIAA